MLHVKVKVNFKWFRSEKQTNRDQNNQNNLWRCMCNEFSNDFFDLPPLPSWSNACTNVLAWWSVIIPSSNLTSNITFKPHFKSWKLTLLWFVTKKIHQTHQTIAKNEIVKNKIVKDCIHSNNNNNLLLLKDKPYLLSPFDPPGRLLQKS